MKLKDLIKDLTKEMKKHRWQEKEVKFQTVREADLDYLSIYIDLEKQVCIDVGKDGE